MVGRVARVRDEGEPVQALDVARGQVDGRVVVADDLVARLRRSVAVGSGDDPRLEPAVRIGHEVGRERACVVGLAPTVRVAALPSGSAIVSVTSAFAANPLPLTVTVSDAW